MSGYSYVVLLQRYYTVHIHIFLSPICFHCLWFDHILQTFRFKPHSLCLEPEWHLRSQIFWHYTLRLAILSIFPLGFTCFYTFWQLHQPDNHPLVFTYMILVMLTNPSTTPLYLHIHNSTQIDNSNNHPLVSIHKHVFTHITFYTNFTFLHRLTIWPTTPLDPPIPDNSVEGCIKVVQCVIGLLCFSLLSCTQRFEVLARPRNNVRK